MHKTDYKFELLDDLQYYPYFNICMIYRLGKQTAILQEDGVFTTTSYLQHNNGIGDQPLEDFTFCLRFVAGFFMLNKLKI